jgi:glycosyltransferase involved in cell wall biosynthesis
LQRLARTELLCVSETTRSALERFEGLGKTRSQVIHPGIDTAEFYPDPVGRATVRERLGIPTTAAVVGIMGRVEPSKRPDLALRAFAAVRRQRKAGDLRFVCVGEGAGTGDLKALSHELNITEACHFPGLVPNDERRAYLAAIDCLLSTSELEGLGMVLLEAMAVGCLVVATDSGGPAEIITEERYGWLVPQHDPPALERALGDALDLNGGARASRADPARARVQTHFDARRQNTKMAEVIERLGH